MHWSGCAFGYRPAGVASLEEYRRSVLARAYAPTEFSLTAVRSKLGFLPGRYVAWHVRRGDKTQGPAKEDDAIPLERYAQATNELLAGDPAPPSHVVICTDSPAVVEEAAQSTLRLGGMQVVFDPDEKRWDGYCALHRAGGIDRTDEMIAEVLTAQKIIEVLRGAECLVGCNSSYLFRVGAMLNPGDRCISLGSGRAHA